MRCAGGGDPGAGSGDGGAVGHLSADEAGSAAAVFRDGISLSKDAGGGPCRGAAGLSVRSGKGKDAPSGGDGPAGAAGPAPEGKE